METGKRLIPYSVHLPEELHAALREHAQNRKASSLVRDAITSMLKGGKPFDSGYNQAIRDVVNLIRKNQVANAISWDGVKIADELVEEIKELQK
jgi:Arc/MetJ-type ribon-helix-helix transcriptional regulator